MKTTKAKKTATVVQAITHHGVTISGGEVSYAGKAVGRLDYDLQHGYHPTALLTVGKNTHRYELDEKGIVKNACAKVAAWLTAGKEVA